MYFNGGIFSEQLEGGRAGAEIRLDAWGIAARTRNDDAYTLPYHACRLELGGASGRMLFCRDAAESLTIFCEDKRFPEALGAQGGPQMRGQLDQISRRRRRERLRSGLWGLFFTALFLFLLGGVYIGIKSGARAAIGALPVSVDQKIGELAIKTMDLKGEKVDDPVLAEAVQTIVERLSPLGGEGRFSFDAQVVDAPIVNAFALPGGRIVLYTGLIEKAETAEQVAGVLAHEMAHVTRRHGLERIVQSVGVVVALDILLGDASGLVALGVELLKNAAVTSYSRAQEAEADEVGIAIMNGSGLRALELAAFFEVLESEGAVPPKLLTWFSSHPSGEDRMQAIRDLAAALPSGDYRPLPLDWKKIREHTRNKYKKQLGEKLRHEG